MEVLQTTIILFILMSCCVGLSPPKKPPCKAHTTPRCTNTKPTPRCGKNEHYVQNSTACEKTCANREFMHLAGACKPISKCVCVGDLMRLNDDATGPCVSEDQCPPGLNCGPYEVASKEKIVCPPQTCESLFSSFFCPPQAPEPGCNCIDGYLRDKSGTCIPSEQCPPYPVEEPCPDGDKNATRQDCPSWCQPTCEYPIPGEFCPAACFPRGCVCKPGFILESRTGQCISPDDCPEGSPPVCGDNEVATSDRKVCPPQNCQSLYIKFSCLEQDPESGCDCVEGYLRDSSGICIPKEQCPPPPELPECGENEYATPDMIVCPPQTCESLYKAYACIPRDPIAGCNCIDGYFRNASGICVPTDQCPPPPSTECGLNEEYSYEKITCPPQSCKSIYTSYLCQQPQPQEAGCNCINGYLRNRSNICIPSEECPPPPSIPECGYNEIYTYRKFSCPPDTCDTLYLNYPCAPPREPGEGCICSDGHLRNASGVCVPIEECPPESSNCHGDRNATYQSCPSMCQPTCENPMPPDVCIAMCAPDGCVCNSGYVLSKEGKCILPQDCPVAPGCNGDRNATYQECPSTCQPTCKEPVLNGPCNRMCAPPGCVCNPGYVLSEDGTCILPQDCPATAIPECGCNEMYTDRKYTCPPESCDTLYLDYLCAADQKPKPGCICLDGHLRNASDVCVPIKECPPGPYFQIVCGPNEEETDEKRSCPPETCESIGRLYKCAAEDPTRGCKCIDGYYRDSNNDCIPEDQCPKRRKPSSDKAESSASAYASSYSRSERSLASSRSHSSGTSYASASSSSSKKNRPKAKDCNGDRNATYTSCTSRCPRSCGSRSDIACAAVCGPPGCQCKPDYVLAPDGKCVLPEDCPATCDDKNAEYQECPSMCQPTCEQPEQNVPCPAVCAPDGCVCKPGFLLSNGKCVLPKDCPGGSPKCPANEQFVYCKGECPNSFCPQDDSRAIIMCDPPYPCPSGCTCKAGFLRKSYEDNVCVKYSSCPAVNCTRQNEVWDPKPPQCIAETCADALNPQPCDKSYPNHTPQCVCKKDHYRNDSDICVPIEECQPNCNGDRNATFQECPSACQPTCDKPEPPEVCIDVCAPDGCVCNPGYVLSKEGKCVLPQDCPVAPGCKGDRNATYQECPSTCQPTCKEPVLKGPCNKMCAPAGCVCNPGYVLSEEGSCILPQDCPAPSCNGDRNATYKECPSVCQPSCEQPNQNVPCILKCAPDGCVCNQGYLLSGGKCVLPKDCPGGSPVCPANEQFVNCKVECPNSYCPVNDKRGILICDPPHPCPFGCSCKAGFKRKSYEDKECIEYSSCPPVNCTRQNEVWNPKPPKCIAERCADALNPQPCNKQYPNYTPQCVCKEGHYRNDSDICVPLKECPAQCSIPERCRPTCSVPNPQNCPTRPPASTNVDGCECQADYILSGVGGKCIRISECPQDQSCNGDPHARIKSCPWSCPATCDSPNASMCDKKCAPVGCECESGYLLSKDGKCILPDDCPRGNPCGPNGTFVDCGFRCPNQYCPEDDSRVQYACKPGRPCPPGCACKINYRRLSYENDTCIEAADCPPVNCTSRPNEVWDPCPSDCLAEDCSNAYDRPTPCYTLLLNCQPKCVCKKDHFRNSSDICVPAKECNTPNPCVSDCAPTCANPNPPDCPFIPQEKKCCEPGYIQIEKGGKCIRIEECPKDVGCNGDPNAVAKKCPAACASTCDKPESLPCDKPCEEVGCECAPGYILSSADGKCIEINKCPGGNPCGPNAMFVGCKNSCPTDYCPVDDRRARIICETYPFAPCYSGCVCQRGYIRNNRKENKCIRPSDCQPVKCTRQNERWDRCPFACLAEGCEDVNNQPTACNTLVEHVCQPRCVCAKRTFRNSTDSCVPACECDI